MPLSWNEIRDRAIAFSKEWEKEESERAEAQSFWNDFFQVYGISRKRVAVFEKQVELSKVKRTVDAAYGKRTFGSDAERVAFLFELYQKYTSLLPMEAKPRRKGKAGKVH